ncbi:MAG: DedA family protein, partial [Xanthomonadales bacterium]|nr:DedA family protein [Xanthomonadales bacterium]
IPYKVFTIASGAAGMPLAAFGLGSAVGRGGRFFLLAGLIAWGGPRLEATLRQWIEWIGWLLAVAAIILIGWLMWRH